MISILLTLIVLAVVLYVVNIIMGMITLPPQVKQIAWVIIGLIVLIYLLSLFGVVDSNILMSKPTLR